MATGDVICPDCGSYQRCGCRRPLASWVSTEEHQLERIAAALEKIAESLELNEDGDLECPNCAFVIVLKGVSDG